MSLRTRKPSIVCVLWMGLLGLTSCAGNIAPEKQALNESSTAGITLTGTVAAIRDPKVEGGASSALQSVLSALHQNQTPAAISGREIVIELSDGNSVAIGESPAAGSFKSDDRVALVEAGQIVLLQRN